MIGQTFINPAISEAILIYLKYKDQPTNPAHNDFLVHAISTLVFIYGELDILNPYITHNEQMMGGFDSNITKYGFPMEHLTDFKKQFMRFREEEKVQARPNTAFIKIEKYLIDMFCYKQKSMNLAMEEFANFKKYLYVIDNPLMVNDLNKYTIDPNEIGGYLKSKMFEAQHQFSLEPMHKEILNSDAYTLLGYNLTQINNLNSQDLKAVNDQIYSFFRVDSTLQNRKELLDKAVNYYKRYGNKITSGNGYVDFLLFASVLATAVFVVMLIALNF